MTVNNEIPIVNKLQATSSCNHTFPVCLWLPVHSRVECCSDDSFTILLTELALMELVSHVGVTRLVLGRTRTNVHACHSCVYIQTHIHVPFLRPNTTKQLVPAHIYVHTRQRGSQTALLCKPPLINTIQPTHSRNVKACMHTMHTRSKQLKQKKWSLSLSLSLFLSLHKFCNQ